VYTHRIEREEEPAANIQRKRTKRKSFTKIRQEKELLANFIREISSMKSPGAQRIKICKIEFYSDELANWTGF
jgi:hypothetical protein